MGQLQSVGSIKLQVSFAECSLFDRALLLERPIFLSILLTKATPYFVIGLRVRVSFFSSHCAALKSHLRVLFKV